MHELTCKDLIAFLDDYVAGELSKESRATFDGHLVICRACREYLAQYTRSIGLVRSLGANGETPASSAGVPEGLVRAVMQAARGAAKGE